MININHLFKKDIFDDRHFISEQKLLMLDTFCKMLEISYDDIEEHDTTWLKNKIRQYKLNIIENG